MDILYRRGRATAGEVMEELSGTPNYSTVRTQLRVLEEKGHVHHEEHGLRYVYAPAVPRSSARKSALRHLVDTFFDGSAEERRRGPARRRGVEAVRRAAGTHCGSREAVQGRKGWTGRKGRTVMMLLLLNTTIKISLIVTAALGDDAAARAIRGRCGTSCSRSRSPAPRRRRWFASSRLPGSRPRVCR